MKESNVNFNKNDCIQSYEKIGKTVYVNVCTNEKVNIPWGIDFYFIAIFLICIILGLIYVLIATCLRWKNLPSNEYEGAENEKLVGVEGTQDIHISPDVINNSAKK